MYRTDLNSVVFFLLSFVAIYSVNETCAFHFSLFRSYFFQSLSFPVFYFPCFYFLSFSSVFLCISSNFSFSFCLFLCMSSTFFPAAFYLSLSSLFVYHLIFLSGSLFLWSHKDKFCLNNELCRHSVLNEK